MLDDLSCLNVAGSRGRRPTADSHFKHSRRSSSWPAASR